MGDASSGLLHLRPVTFRCKQDLDPSGTRQYGFIAEEVAEVLPDLVVRDKQGEVQGVRYDLIAPLLLNEVQKQAQKIDRFSARLVKLEATLAAQQEHPVDASYKNAGF